MDKCLQIFQGLFLNEEIFLDIYLDALDEHKQLDDHNPDENSLVQQISSLLTASKTRALGIRLLNKFLDDCSLDVLEKKGNLWTTLVLKLCNTQELRCDDPIIFCVLNKLIKSSEEVPDLAKSFVSHQIPKIYESLTNVPLSKLKWALNCIETCLRVYPAASGPSRGAIQRLLWKNIDLLDYDNVQKCGKCLHLLQQLKTGGAQALNQKAQWKKYQCQLLGGIHSVYNEMFANCMEMYGEKIEEEEELPCETEQTEFDPDPVKKAAQMYTRCRNLLTFLSIALREPFPTVKPILVNKIITVLIRGLGVNCLMLELNPTADNIAFSILLPKLHVDLLNLLNVALTILQGHLRPYSNVILGLMLDELKWTSFKNERKYCSLRKKVYDSLSVWCKIFGSGNGCEIISEHLFEEILRDIAPTQNEFTLQVLSGTRKHMSKAARRQLKNAQQEKSKIVKTYSANCKRQKNLAESENQKLCKAALGCLQEVLLCVGNILKPTLLKTIQSNIAQIATVFHTNTVKADKLYSSADCRIEIYNALYSIIIITHYLCPPPTEFIFGLIKTGHVRDDSLTVRQHCGVILRNLEKIIHPQKESLLFTIDARDVRNAFIKVGRENLLREFEINLSNSNCIDDTINDEEILINRNGEIVNKGNETQHKEETQLGEVLHNGIEMQHKEILDNGSEESRHDEILSNDGEETTSGKVLNNEGEKSRHDEILSNDGEETTNGKILDNGSEESRNDEIPSNDGEETTDGKVLINLNKEIPHYEELHNGNEEMEHEIKTQDDVPLQNENDNFDIDKVNVEGEVDEPLRKKQKFYSEHQETEGASSVDHNEDNMLDEIVSEFVDELDEFSSI